MVDTDIVDALPEGYCLHWYRIEKVLGRGGFGITYLARDTNLDHLVAIKEYMPSVCATRSPGDSSVRAFSTDMRDTYIWGLKAFITEAQTLAKFKHPNIVRVLSVFEQLGTAYMVMEFEEGEELAHLIKRGKHFGESEIVELVLTLLNGLKFVHAAGFIHRDIKPQNIVIRQDGSPVLLDFGSARKSMESKKRQLTSMVTGGYSPIEQYNQGDATQGAWTDVYGMAATLYTIILGVAPPDAISRATAMVSGQSDPLIPVSIQAVGKYSATLLSAIDEGLRFQARDRPQSIEQWVEMLTGRAQPDEKTVLPPPLKLDLSPKSQNTETSSAKLSDHSAGDNGKRTQNFSFFLLVGIVGAVLTFVGAIYLVVTNVSDQQRAATSAPTTKQGEPAAKQDAPQVTGLSSASNKPNEVKEGVAAVPPQRDTGAEAVIPAKVDASAKFEGAGATAASASAHEEEKQPSANESPQLAQPPVSAAAVVETTPTTAKTTKNEAVTVKPPTVKDSTGNTVVLEKKPKETEKVLPAVTEKQPVVQIDQTAPKLLENILKAFNSGSEQGVRALLKTSNAKSNTLSTLFSQYKTRKVGVSTFSFVAGKNEAIAQLRIEYLTNKEDQHVEPAASWRDINIKMSVTADGKTQAYWQ